MTEFSTTAILPPTILDGHQILNVHASWKCHGFCTFHHPSDHHMVNWPIALALNGVGLPVPLVVRFCEHGEEHPDPDSAEWCTEAWANADPTYLNSWPADYDWSIHSCDGCCTKDPLEEARKNWANPEWRAAQAREISEHVLGKEALDKPASNEVDLTDG